MKGLFMTRSGKKGQKVKFQVDASYAPSAGAAKKHTRTGHVTLMK